MEFINVLETLNNGEVLEFENGLVSQDGEYFVVEKYEYTTSGGDKMYSVYDSYTSYKKAIRTVLNF